MGTEPIHTEPEENTSEQITPELSIGQEEQERIDFNRELHEEYPDALQEIEDYPEYYLIEKPPFEVFYLNYKRVSAEMINTFGRSTSAYLLSPHGITAMKSIDGPKITEENITPELIKQIQDRQKLFPEGEMNTMKTEEGFLIHTFSNLPETIGPITESFRLMLQLQNDPGRNIQKFQPGYEDYLERVLDTKPANAPDPSTKYGNQILPHRQLPEDKDPRKVILVYLRHYKQKRHRLQSDIEKQ